MLDRNEMILRDDRHQAMQQYMPPRPMPFTPPPEPEEPSLLASVFRHKWIVFLVTSVFLAAACVYLKKTEPLYTSTAKVLIETTPAPFFGSDQGIPREGSGNSLVTQCSIMKSSTILSLVMQRPEVTGLSVFANGVNPIDYLQANLSAEVGKKDDIIEVSIQTPNPKDSAVLVNAVVAAYKDYQAISKKGGFGLVLDTLQPQLDALEAKIANERKDLEELLRKNPSMQITADGTANSPAFINMNVASQRYSEIRLQRSDAEFTYGAAAPQMRMLRAREEQAYKEFLEAQTRAMETNKVLAEYTKLKSDLDQDKVYATPMRDRISTLTLNRDLQSHVTSVSQLETGQVATKPSFPKKTNTLGLAGVLGLICGGALAFLRDRTDGRLRTAEEIQNIVALPILGVVPRMPGRRTAVARAMAVHLDPRSEVAEAYRTIRTAVYFGVRGTRARTLLVTSPEAGDGKTTSASNLAIAIAQTGRSVLLLDADFRKPTQHKNLDIKDSVGLSSVLAGTETLDRAIQRTGVDGLDILPCGAIPGNPSEILNSQEFGELVDRLAMKYDHILFDSPPVNLVTDARILGAVCDATVLVLRAEKSTRKAAEHARNALLSVGAKLLGAVVNDVPRGKGYETYGGSYYGTHDMRSPGDINLQPQNNGVGNNYLTRLPRSTADVSDT